VLTILDRYLLRSLIVNYLIGLSVMLSLYIVLDMFVNMDEFTEHGYPVWKIALNMASYYWPNMFLYFSQLSGIITLVACMATLARARQQNELTAVLASGVSLYRLAAPIMAFGIVTTALLVLDTEVIVPSIAHLLARDHDDADGSQAYEVLFMPDRNNVLLSARQYHPIHKDLTRLLALVRDDSGKVVQTIEADHANWEPPDNNSPIGHWRLERGVERTRKATQAQGLGPSSGVEVRLVDMLESDLSPSAIELRQARGWIRYLSLSQLRALQNSGSADRAEIIQIRHGRIAAPLVGMVLLLLGLPFFLDRSPTNLLNDTGKCMILCSLCYIVTFVAQNVKTETLSALPAWIPIFVFSTIAMVLIDRIRT